MSRKSFILALAATVSLGAFALSSSTASAFHGGGGGGSHVSSGGARAIGGGGLKFGGGLHVNRPMVNGIKIPGKVTGIVINKPNHHWYWPRWYRWHAWARPYWVAPAIAAGGVAAYATTPTTNRCTCLTKEYTQQGQVVFKDVCTNEMAINPPANASPAAYNTAPEMPQQQGYLQPQAQP